MLGAQWAEFDLVTKVWTVPAVRMKGRREHRVPLSAAALQLLEGMTPLRSMGDYMFPGARRGPFSNMAMEMILRRMGVGGVTVHGFRRAFRDWTGDETDYPREVAEAALAHAVADKVEAAYRRGSALEKRRALMDAWARYCKGGALRSTV